MSFLSSEYTIGVNKIFLGIKKFQIYPRYYVAVNDKVLNQSVNEIKALTSVKFLSHRAKHLYPEGPLTYFINSVQGPQAYFHDIAEGVREGGTVTFAALQIAFYLGFSEVIIIGLDHRYDYVGKPNESSKVEGPDINHFSSNYFGFGQSWDNPDLAKSEQSYRVAKLEYEKVGRQILDATVEGACTVFSKVDYRKVFDT